MPALAAKLDGVVNVFDPLARDRVDYYRLAWKPGCGAESDDVFRAA